MIALAEHINRKTHMGYIQVCDKGMTFPTGRAILMVMYSGSHRRISMITNNRRPGGEHAKVASHIFVKSY